MSPEIVTGHESTFRAPTPLNTTTLIRNGARTYPEQEIVYRTADGGWDRYTYGDCFRRVAQSAHALRELGLGAGDVIGVLDWNSRRFFELYWSVPGIAATLLEINLRLAPADLVYVVDHAEATAILVDETLLPVAEAVAPKLPSVKTWVVMSDRPMAELSTTLPGAVHYEDLLARQPETYDWPLIDEDSACYACYTTGTTGRPKGVFYSHRAIFLHTMSQASGLGMTADDAVIMVTPMFHANCWGLPQGAVYACAKVVLPGRFAAEELQAVVDAMIAEKVTVANGAPAIFGPMLNYIKTLEEMPDFGSMRLLSGATEPPLSMMRDYKELTGADFIHGYGSTETTPLVTANRGIKPALAGLSEDEKWDRKRYQGLPVPAIDVRVVDPLGEDLPHDGVSSGELWIRGPWITSSYYKKEVDEEQFVDGWWRSGDVGVITEDGYVKLTDRLKDVIKSGGEWISSIDMENAVVAHPRIAEAAVIGVPHPKWQERPVVVAVSTDGEEVPLEEIHELLSGSFADWQLPELVIWTEQLPRTSVGKLDKKVMRGQYEGVYE